MADMKDRLGTIISNKEIANDVYKAVIQFDDLPADIKGGQFLHLKLNDNSHVLRRPFCICDFDKKANTVTVCYAVIGEGTKELSTYKEGTGIYAMLPLGNGFVPGENMKKVVLLGGGMGGAVLPAIARRDGDRQYYCYLGFASKDKVVLEKELRDLTGNVVVATDDGSYGRKGFVTDILAQDMAKIKPDVVFCCGPEVMYRALKKVLAPFNVPIMVSLEARMGCGIGACLVCNCKIKRNGQEGYLRVCADGPVFALDEVVL